MRKRSLRRSAVWFGIVAVLSVASYEGYGVYIQSLEVTSTQDVDLHQYQPFANHTKAVSLEQPSTLQLKDQLPRLDGATALYPVYAGFVQAVYPEGSYDTYTSEVVSSQTDEAFNRLLASETDIIFMAEPSEEQKQLAQEKGIDLTLTPIGFEAFVFFVHKNNPVASLTIAEIKKIYSGQLTNWNELGGKNRKIRAFQRPEGSGSQSALLRLMGDTPVMNPPSKDVASGMGGMITEVATYQNRTNAIGYSFRHFSQDMVNNGEIKYLAIEGVSLTKENIQNESYPIVANFYAITTADNANRHIKEFIDWMLSEQGQQIVEETGYVRAKKIIDR